MTLKTISDFKAKLKGGGARPNLFEVKLNFPNNVGNLQGGANNDLTSFLVKTAALPASNVTPIDVAFRGRILKIAGDRTFDTWTVTVINDTDFAIRHAFEDWMNQINNVETAQGLTTPTSYYADAYVHQLDRDGEKLRTYRFHDVFPTNVSQIDLSYDTTDTLEEFTVELQVQWWEAIGGTSPNSGGGNISGTKNP
jgi:hypothetical protein